MQSHLWYLLQAGLKWDSQAGIEAVNVLALKCRDKDAHVREAAYEMLAALPAQSLHAALLPSDWRAVIDSGLGVWAELSRAGLLMTTHTFAIADEICMT